MGSAADDDQVTGVMEVIRASEPRRMAATDPELDAAVDELLNSDATPGLVFQPIVDMSRQVTVGYEALTRFHSALAATPDRWFIAAERIGRAAELEARVIRGALAIRASLPSDCFLSINVAPEALLSPPVQALLRSTSLARVVFELTEHSAVSDYDLLGRAVSEVRGHGAFVAVDDAGAGYASLQHVLVLRPDFVKLDRALIAGLQLDEAKAALIEMFGGFTSRIDAWLLAEGIEERAELARLLQLGVPLGQGYLLGRPQPHMNSLDRGIAVTMSELVPDQGPQRTLRHLSELSTVARADASEAELLALFDKQPGHHTVVLLDDATRPVALVSVGVSGLERHAVMSVLDLNDLHSALKRALTRPPSTRFHPLACCDQRGHYRGIVRIERLVEALLP